LKSYVKTLLAFASLMGRHWLFDRSACYFWLQHGHGQTEL